jgi:hypothetical protein
MVNHMSKHNLYYLLYAPATYCVWNQFIIGPFYCCCYLYKGLMIYWFNPKHVAKAYKREFKLCLN